MLNSQVEAHLDFVSLRAQKQRDEAQTTCASAAMKTVCSEDEDRQTSRSVTNTTWEFLNHSRLE